MIYVKRGTCVYPSSAIPSSLVHPHCLMALWNGGEWTSSIHIAWWLCEMESGPCPPTLPNGFVKPWGMDLDNAHCLMALWNKDQGQMKGINFLKHQTLNQMKGIHKFALWRPHKNEILIVRLLFVWALSFGVKLLCKTLYLTLSLNAFTWEVPVARQLPFPFHLFKITIPQAIGPSKSLAMKIATRISFPPKNPGLLRVGIVYWIVWVGVGEAGEGGCLGNYPGENWLDRNCPKGVI